MGVRQSRRSLLLNAGIIPTAIPDLRETAQSHQAKQRECSASAHGQSGYDTPRCERRNGENDHCKFQSGSKFIKSRHSAWNFDKNDSIWLKKLIA